MSGSREKTPRDFYEGIDDFKLLALTEAAKTANNIDRLGIKEVSATRGESAQVIDLGDKYLASVNEELGTKNLIADELERLTGKSYYFNVGLDTAAAQFNDLITVGADPVSSHAHFVAGGRDLFTDQRRVADLLSGYKHGCDLAGANWVGGETGLLEGLVEPGSVVLSGSANGIIFQKEQLVTGDKLQHGDMIIYLPSSGLHANGATPARQLVENLPDGYTTFLQEGITYGEALLEPTPIYYDAARSLAGAGVDIHYMSNITGHGWRKLMRANRELTYVITFLPENPPELFDFIQRHSGKSDGEMYRTFNMGMGFAIYVSRDDLAASLKALQNRGWPARLAGHVEEGPRKVVIKPKDLVFGAKSLGIQQNT